MSDDNVSNKQRHFSPHMLLLEYPFLMPLVLEFLDDKDVLTRLLVTGKSIKSSLTGYKLKIRVTPSRAKAISGWNMYLPVMVQKIHDWNGEDLRSHGALQEVLSKKSFKGPIGVADLPISLTSLTLSDVFNAPIDRGMPPPFLKTVVFGNSFNQPIPFGVLPSKVKTLLLGSSFNQKLVPGAIPQSVETMFFGLVAKKGQFNKPLVPGTLPNSLISLFAGAAFNQPLLPNVIPASVSTLFLGTRFNHPLHEDVMPSKITFLRLGAEFSAALFMPPMLQQLHLACPLHKICMLNSMPISLTELQLKLESDDVLPAGLLPTSLRKLTVRQPVVIGSIPVGVTELRYGANCALPVGSIPETVIIFTFDSSYNLPVLPGVIPDSVKSISFGKTFNQIILPQSIPSVTHVSFGKDFNTLLLPGVLPDSVTHICFDRVHGCFNHPLFAANDFLHFTAGTVGSIPRSVTHLTMSRDFNQPLSLPNITHLSIGKKFSQSLTADVLPSSLEVLMLPEGCSLNFKQSECHFRIRISNNPNFL